MRNDKPLDLLKSLNDRIEHMQNAERFVLVLLFAGLVSWLDIATPPYVFVQGFYLLPIFLAAWYCGPYLTIFVVGDASITNFYMSRQIMPGDASFLEVSLTYS